ncbi:MAG TPA: ATP-binding cassette domain-containing protein, partial [Roseiflexaceae bacterium]|nr:ATP-binding cassette domain-containing protein [Roseiflexaceae bacterium]
MIDFRNLTYTYPGAALPALRDVTLHVPDGGFALLIGASGCGKSTLARCVGGLVPHFSGGALRGKLSVGGHDPAALGPSGMSRLVGYVFQDPEAQAVMDRVEDEIAFALEHAGLPRQEMRVRVEETLDLLDLAALRDRALDSLSGGERQRVAIAAALALQPRILVLDEPTSQLDPQSAEDVLQALVRLNHDLGLTILLVEHRLERVLPFVDQVIVLSESGALSGSPADVMPQIALAPPLIALAKALGWSPLPLTIKAGLRFSRALAPPAAPAAPDAPAATPFFELRRVDADYGGRPALSSVDLAVAAGEIVALLGRNGAGKTTLLKCLVGLHRPTRGRAIVGGQDTAGHDVAAICRMVGYLPQDPNALLFADSVREELLITLRNHGLTDQGTVDELLARLGLAQHANAYPRDLSVGERQRVALGAIMITRPQALLLDEPTRGLDYAAKQQLAELLREWRSEGMATLLVTHDVEFAALLADRVILLGRGEVIADGSAAGVLGASPL